MQRLRGSETVYGFSFAEATLTDDDRTLADAVEEIVTSEFTDLTPEEKAPKMKSKPVRSTAGKER